MEPEAIEVLRIMQGLPEEARKEVLRFAKREERLYKAEQVLKQVTPKLPELL